MEIKLEIKEKTPIWLSSDEALLFKAFQQHYQVVARIIGSMEALRINDIANASVVMDFDANGIIQHSAITKHYRR